MVTFRVQVTQLPPKSWGKCAFRMLMGALLLGNLVEVQANSSQAWRSVEVEDGCDEEELG
jgi:hypothetical protein